MIQFQLPSNLTPTIFSNDEIPEFTPLIIDYAMELEFLTEKNDKYVFRIPVVIEDNFPPREIVPPPRMPPMTPSSTVSSPPSVAPPSMFHQHNAPVNERNYSPYHQGNEYPLYQTPEQNIEPPPAYASPPPSYNPMPNSNPSSISNPIDNNSLYPVLPGMKPYSPPSEPAFSYQPAFNPAYADSQ